MSDRRCEHCGRSMIDREHRAAHPQTGKKVCSHCLSANTPEWMMTHGQIRTAALTIEGRRYEYRGFEADPGTPDGWLTEQRTNYVHSGGIYSLASNQHVAHDSGDGETLAHCPFCGSGSLLGGQDGTVECQFCRRFFTVQVQPEFAAMPQTINGQPFNIPGMPGGGPDAGGAQDQRAQSFEDAQSGDEPPTPDDPAEKAEADEAQEHQFGTTSMLVTADGIALPYEAYLQRIALEHAEDRSRVLASIRQENGLPR